MSYTTKVSIAYPKGLRWAVAGASLCLFAWIAPAAADQVFNDDLIVIGSECLGTDCADGESFGFDTLRLKENNTRIQFLDTSASGSFADADWRLEANESSSGGANQFAIAEGDTENSTTEIFKLQSGAPADSLFVDSSGRVGFGTATPVMKLHSADGDTPTLRLEQDGSSGWTPQTWDLASNEANFFVRDVTNGSLLPFRVRPGAPTSSLDIAGNGNVGINTASPNATLHVKRSDGTGQILVEETSSNSVQTMFELINAGHPKFRMEDASQNDVRWEFRTAGAEGTDERFMINKIGSGALNASFQADGDLVIAGTLAEGSTRDSKTAIEAVNADALLAKLTELPIAEWQYNDSEARHIGPMAEDFHAVYGLGPDNKHIAPKDMAGVAMASAKALRQENEVQQERIEKLEEQNKNMAARLEELEQIKEQLATIQSRLPDRVALQE